MIEVKIFPPDERTDLRELACSLPCLPRKGEKVQFGKETFTVEDVIFSFSPDADQIGIEVWLT